MFLILMASLLQQPLSPVVTLAPVKPQYPSAVGGKTLAEWLKVLNDSKDAAVREMAVKAIPAFGPAARDPSIKPLVKACREDGDPGVRVNAILTLGAVGANNKDEAKIIIDALRIAIANASPGGIVRLHAARAIGNYGMYPEQANDAIFTLRDIAKDLSWETRKTVAFALGRIGGPTKDKPKPDPNPLPLGSPPPIVDPKTGPEISALKVLQGMLGDSSATVRLEVVESLVLLGPPAVSSDQYSATISPYMTAIQDRMKIEKEKGVTIWLHVLQMRYDGNSFNEQTMNKIVEMGRSAEAESTVQALTALSLLGEKAHVPAIPFARDMLAHTEPYVVATAANYLAGTGIASKVALPQLEAVKKVKENEKKESRDEMLIAALARAIDSAKGIVPAMPPALPVPKK